MPQMTEVDLGQWEFPAAPWESDPALYLLPSVDSSRPGGASTPSISSIYDEESHSDTESESGRPFEDVGSQHLTGLLLNALVAGLTMAAFLLMIDSTILVTAIPTITTYFNSLADVGWYGSSYLLATCTLQMLFGKVYMFYNSKIVFLSAFLIFEAGSLICAVAQSSPMFIGGRVVSGVGGAGILNGAFTIMAAAAPLQDRPKLIGIILGVASTGVALGPLIGGALTQNASWRWCFYINLPAGAITVISLGLIRIPDARVSRNEGPVAIPEQIKRLDLPGCALFASSVISLLLALDWGGVTYAWNSATIICLFWTAGITLVLFLAWERHMGDTAMLPLSLLKQSAVSCAAAAGIMSYGGLYVIITYLPMWFQAVKDVSPLMSGVYYLPSVISTTLSTVGSGFLVSKYGQYTPFMIAGGALAAIAAGQMSTFVPSSGPELWVTYQLLNGIARGMMAQQPVTAMQANLSPELISIGTALVVFSQNFGASVFISLGQTTFENSLLTALGDIGDGVDVQKVADAGATDFRSAVPEGMVDAAVQAYNDGLISTFYLSAGASVVVFVLAWGFGFKSVKKTPDSESD
ncbi:hypothetical protein FE257_008144 [Aspergillus nanangensis]|uniref:Major facilitator superfamily (MFS) profile domain-containing protein n=1 Tax=Aspergillus nanangensis TaxID=2582783 RepID=A0AAD4GSY3_ASPNN|nr:hypothetical protein FE257_008144 [Aspergillus nanangensis]